MWLRLSYLSALFGLCLFQAGCGFEPVYGARGAAGTGGNMVVEPIPGREGQILKIALEDALNPESVSVLNAPYSLRVTLRRDLIPAVVADDASIRRYNVLMLMQYSVVDRATAKVLHQGNAKRYGSYSRSSEDYSTFVADEDVSKRTLEELARDVAQRIGAMKLPASGTGL